MVPFPVPVGLQYLLYKAECTIEAARITCMSHPDPLSLLPPPTPSAPFMLMPHLPPCHTYHIPWFHEHSVVRGALKVVTPPQ